jgi:YVTN family beta-propeller protein
VTNYNRGTVQVINGYEITAGFRAPSYPFNALTDVAVDPVTHTAYITDEEQNTVSLINGATAPPTVTKTLPVGSDPVGVAVDPTSHTAYIANGADTSVSVAGPPSIITPPPAGSLPEGPLGLAYSTSMQVFGGGTPYSWSATGLPVGLAINPATGVISGYPSAVGTSQVTVSVSAPPGRASKRFSLTIALPPKTNPCKPGTCA